MLDATAALRKAEAALVDTLGVVRVTLATIDHADGVGVDDRLEALQVGSLTARERQILTLMADGLSSREMGAALGITQNTARTHTQNVLSKLGGGRMQAIRIAQRYGIISPADQRPPLRAA